MTPDSRPKTQDSRPSTILVTGGLGQSMMMKQNDIIGAFQEVRAEFPFPGYMDNTLGKYTIIISQIVKEHPPKSKILSVGSGPCDLEAILSKLGYEITAIDDLNDQWHLIGKIEKGFGILQGR